MTARRSELPISTAVGPLEDATGDTLVLGLAADALVPRGAVKTFDTSIDHALSRFAANSGFRGKANEVATLCPAHAKIKRLVLVGLGPSDKIDLEAIRAAAATALRQAARGGSKRVAFALFPAKRRGVEERARAMAEGIALGAYRDDRWRSSARRVSMPTRALLLLPESVRGAAAEVKRGRLVAEAANFTRDLSNTPPNELTPAALANHARRLATSRKLRCKILTPPELKKAGMGGILAVGGGSANGPRFVHLEYRPAKAKRTVALVGKGITFDTGGISLKPTAGMWDMKYDKCGATAVLGAIRAAADLSLPIRVHALVAAAENMPSRDAYRPGDVVKTASGKTIEIRSTDAEGRIVLADALDYALTLEPDAIVDLATLTGACKVALGSYAAGLFTSDDQLAKALERAADDSGERVWRLPLAEEFRRHMDSKVADLKNSGLRWGGACSAAAFLSEFVDDRPWAHLDIAGMSDTDRTSGYDRVGSTGFGARLLAAYLERSAK